MLAVLIALTVGFQSTGKLDISGLFRSQPELGGAYQRGFRSDAMIRINRIRGPLEVEQVSGDEAVQARLVAFIENHENPGGVELEEVFDDLQAKFPGAQYLAANLITSTNREALLKELAAWSAAANSDFDTVNTAVFHDGRKLGAIGVMSRRIPMFSLKQANHRGGRFFNRCPHCDEVHALEIEKESRTLILSCPYCDLPFDVLAADTTGTIRRASDFFEGFELVEHPAAKVQLTAEQRIVALWRRVAERCEYELDQDRSDVREVWKGPQQTWDEMAGDCEDTSILLADALISAGFNARVAIGWNGNIGQHAWVVVQTGDSQYVLESTLQCVITKDNLVDASDAAAFYQPEQLFDRTELYFTTARPEHFQKDYFSPKLWRSIPSGGVESATQLSITLGAAAR